MAKKKVICDTDVMIEYWDKTKSRHVVTKSTLETSIELNNVILSAITKMELMMGAVNKTDMLSITQKLTRFNIALINNDITIQSIRLLQQYKLSHGLMLADSFIAATALITGLEIYTYNIKDFTFISGLKIVFNLVPNALPFLSIIQSQNIIF